MTRRARLVVLAFAATIALVLAACGGSDDDNAEGTSTTSEAPAEPTEVRAAPEGEVADGQATPSSGCGTSEVGAQSLTKQTLADSDRWWLLTTPDAHDGEQPLPLVLDFHGLAEGADVHSRMSNLTEMAEAEGFILAVPNGTGTPLRWEVSSDPAETDMAFASDMLDQLEDELCVDTSRVYATGLSNGAFMTSAMACAFSDRIAAVAPVAGVIVPEDCDPGRPVPILSFHGTEDAILLFNGGVGDSLANVLGGGSTTDPADLPPADIDGPGYPANAAERAELNGCGDSEDSELTDTVIHRVWDCPAEGASEFIIIEGGGHTWPGSEFSAQLERVMGATDMSIDANELMWAFFQRFQLPA